MWPVDIVKARMCKIWRHLVVTKKKNPQTDLFYEYIYNYYVPSGKTLMLSWLNNFWLLIFDDVDLQQTLSLSFVMLWLKAG